jgi:NAD(P)H-dependent flavin oxidoreductase YrpB (nitropropane dioxygenase family)
MVATMPLVPAVVDAVRPTPVVAAGGIADGRGLAAVLALGAAGAWMGTRFLVSYEAAIHHRYRELLLRANENDTVYLDDLFDVRWPNAPHRTLRNKTVEAWQAAGRPASGHRPGEGEVIATSRSSGPIVRYQSYTPVTDTEATSTHSLYGPDKAWALFRSCSRRVRSYERLPRRPHLYFGS